MERAILKLKKQYIVLAKPLNNTVEEFIYSEI